MNKIIKLIPLEKVIIGLAVIAIAFILWFTIKKIYRKFLKDTESKTFNTFARVSVGIIRFVIVIITFLIILRLCGVNVSSAFAGLGIVGIVIGLALQDILKDVIMGVHIIFDNFYSIGDCVEYEGKEAVVYEFTMKTTKLRLLCDNSIVSICNRNIDKVRRIGNVLDFCVPMPYDVPNAKVRDFLFAVCDKFSALSEVEKCEYKGACGFGESSVPHSVWVYCKSGDRYEVRLKCTDILLNSIDESDIDIPFNQLDVHMK